MNYGDHIPQLELLASLECQLSLGLALNTLQPQYNLLCGLCLLVEDRLGLTSITGLLAIITTLTLGKEGCLPEEKKRDVSIRYTRIYLFGGGGHTFPALY